MGALLAGLGSAVIPTVSKLLGGIGGSSGQDPTKNALREQQLQAAEAAARQGDPQAVAELQAWNRPGPTNAEAQAFLAQSGLAGQPSGATFSGNYSQFTGGGPGAGGAAGSGLGGIVSGNGAGSGSVLGQAGNVLNSLQAAQATANQNAQLNASRAAAQNSYAQRAGIRGQALAGLQNFQQAPDLSADFASSNPFARQGAMPYNGLASTAGAAPLYAGNAQSPAAFGGAPITTPNLYSPPPTTTPPAIGGVPAPASAPKPIGGI